MARELEEEKQLQNMEDLQSEIASLEDKEKVMSLSHYEVIIVGFSLILFNENWLEKYNVNFFVPVMFSHLDC